MYTSLDTDKDCDLLHDRPVFSTGRTPHDKQSHNCLHYNQNLVMSPREAQSQDGLTEWQTGLADWLTDWLSDWLNWLTEWLAGLAYWMTDWLTEWLTELADWVTGWLTDCLTDWVGDWFTDWVTDWTGLLTDWLIDWVSEWLSDCLTDSDMQCTWIFWVLSEIFRSIIILV
jgi:hypothetical protein